MDTVFDLRQAMLSYPDNGVAIVIQGAIDQAIANKGLKDTSILDCFSLEQIRQSIFDLHEKDFGGKQNSFQNLVNLMGGLRQDVENALQYIEKMQWKRNKNAQLR